MKLNVLDWLIIIDTLVGSLRIIDGGQVFTYRKQNRQNVLDKIHKLIQQIQISND